MRTLSATLKAGQQKRSRPAIYKVVLTQGQTTYTYTQTSILPSIHKEEPYSHTCNLVLNNSAGTLTSIDFQGYQADYYWGVTTSGGDEYSQAAPQWVASGKLNSAEGLLTCELETKGIPDFLADDRASEAYVPGENDTQTVKDLIIAVLGGTLDCYDHCLAIAIVWDSEDSLIDSFIPKNGFRIPINGSRLATLRRLLDYTKEVVVFENDGKAHFMEATTTGTTYDYEYELKGDHTFFAKAYRKRLVIPNYVVVQSREHDVDDYSEDYSGNAQDSTSINAFREVRQYFVARLTSNAQAASIAAAMLYKYQAHAEMGSASVPMNVGAEIHDYVKVTDARENDNRIGNIGAITRYFGSDRRTGGAKFEMGFSFGGWLSIRKISSDLDVYPDGPNWFGDSIYAKYIYAEQIDVDYLSAIAADMGILNAGEIRIGVGDLDDDNGTATGGSATTLVDSGQSWTPDDLIKKYVRIYPDDQNYPYVETEITDNDGTSLTFTSISAQMLAATNPSRSTVQSGDTYAYGWGTFTGFRLWTDITASGALGRIAGFNAGVIQAYFDSDGKFYAGAGSVRIEASGIQIDQGNIYFYHGATAHAYDTQVGNLTTSTGQMTISTSPNANLYLGSGGTGVVIIESTGNLVRANVDNDSDLGSTSYQWKGGYFGSRLKIPVGADMYD